MKLLPCPFCGSEAQHYTRYVETGPQCFEPIGKSVGCTQCKVTTVEYDTPDKAAAVWNQREVAK